jgi:hypothetical protein
MFNLHYSGSTNNFNTKIKPQHTNSITQNSKLNQYLEKNRKIHKSPAHILNKSQNISGAKNSFKTNIKNKIINNNKSNLNAKKIVPFQNLKNFYLINKNNNSIKINTLPYQSNLNISKNNSLSNYFTKACNIKNPNLRRNNTNTNILKMNNNTNFNTTNNAINTNYYQNKSTLYKVKKSPITKIKDYLVTDDFIINKNNNRNSSLYQLAITEESKKNINTNEKKNKASIKKTESVSNTFVKKNHASIKKVKTSSTSILNKKFILNSQNNKNNQNNSRVQTSILGPASSSGGFNENLSTEKTSGCARMENCELKIMNEIKELKNCKNNEIFDKIKIIFEEAIDSLIPKESRNIFLSLLKEICNINNEYLENINNLKAMIEHLKSKMNNYESKYSDLVNKYKSKEKELMNLKKEVEKFFKENEKKNNNEKTKIKNKKNSSFDQKIKRGNTYFTNLNVKNIDDLDALYFFDKIEYNQNNENEIPKLNLESKYIEKCIQKEIIKRNEVNLTPFQKIALQFEMSDT